MKLLVTIKRVPDPDTRVRVRPDGGGIVTDGVKFGVNPFDAIAMEEAQRIRESKGNIEIVAVGIGRVEEDPHFVRRVAVLDAAHDEGGVRLGRDCGRHRRVEVVDLDAVAAAGLGGVGSDHVALMIPASWPAGQD